MPGAQSLVAANYIYNVAPRDGTVIATLQKEIPFVGLMNGEGVQFDARKFTWLGSTADGRKDTVILWANELNFRDDFIIGAESPTAGNMALLLNKLLHTKFKIVSGYQTTAMNRLALERKEVDAEIYSLSGIKTQKPEWLQYSSMIKPMLQFGNGTVRHIEYPDISTVAEQLNENDRELFAVFESQFILLRPYFAPPNIPLAKANELQSAFEAAVQDSDYIKDALAAHIDVNLINHMQAEAILNKASNAPVAILDQLRAIYNEHN
jgi:hypothetical protein